MVEKNMFYKIEHESVYLKNTEIWKLKIKN